MVDRIRAWVNGGGYWRHLALHLACQAPTLALFYWFFVSDAGSLNLP